jgi:dihydrofolate reductase
MIVSFLAAMDRNLVIGDERGIPWHLPADLKRFRRLTLGKPIVMGRTTFEHIGKPLDKRVNFVLSRRTSFLPDGALVVHSMEEVVRLAGGVPELVVVGGGRVFEAALPLVGRMYLTFVDGEFPGTAYFPESVSMPPGTGWVETLRETHPADEKNPYPHQYVVVERVLLPGSPGGQLSIRSLIGSP